MNNRCVIWWQHQANARLACERIKSAQNLFAISDVGYDRLHAERWCQCFE